MRTRRRTVRTRQRLPRSARRNTKRSPDHVSSMAHTLLSTSPFESPISRTGFSERSDATSDVRFGHAIQSHAERHRCAVVRDYCGHGVGRVFHDAPSVLHYGKPGEGLVLRPGMIFTIEPMVNAGTWQVKLKKDGWTVITRDRQLSAQFEHTVGVTADGREVFTISPAGKHHPPW